MIISQDKQDVENLEDFKSKSFGFHKSAKAFQLIIKNIYSNPVRCCLLELVQNARDQNLLIGKSLDTIEIHLPSRLNPEFKVVDFATGISHKFMMEKYTLAFYSSKDQNADMAGGFGCGRLSALALTSTYNVISTHNGKRYYYSIFVNSEGEPEIVTLNHEDTQESNGFVVSLPVLPEHVPQFHEEAKRIFKYWKVKPTIKNVDNFVIPEIVKEIEGASWMIAKEYPPNGPQVIAGIYSYDININNIPNLNAQQTAILMSEGLVLFMGASDVSPQVNRQGLTYDSKTIKNIKAALDSVVNDVGAAIQREFDKCTSSWDAKLLYHKYFHTDGIAKNIGSLLGEKYKVKWNGMEIEDTVFEFLDKDGKEIEGIGIVSYYQTYRRGGNYATECARVYSIFVTDKKRLYVNDLDNPNMGVTKRMRYIMNLARMAQSPIDPCVVTFKDTAARQLFFDRTQLTEQHLLSVKAIEVPKELSNRSYEKNSKHTSKVFEFDYEPRTYRNKQSDCWTECEIDIAEEEGVYIEIDKFIPINSSNQYTHETLTALEHFKLWSEDDVLIGVKKKSKQLTEIKASPNWKSFEQYIKGFANQLILTDEELQKMADYDYFHAFSCEFKDNNNNLQYLVSLVEKLDKNHLICDYHYHLNNFIKSTSNYDDISLKIRLMKRLDAEIVNNKKVSVDLDKKRKKLRKLYPLIFENGYYLHKYSEYFFDYVRGVDLRLAESKNEPF